ncbi:unnamed protein product [Brugia timori]|uniref:Uncharacterized protein n=1 Tax=Brugia timori TaxID=42155 RepID=A0A3P7SVG1_9BILA|nr:unnamed protein product [Brugia timori]
MFAVGAASRFALSSAKSPISFQINSFHWSIVKSPVT